MERKLSIFEKYLTVWVLLCIAAGVFLGRLIPGTAKFLDSLSIYQVSIFDTDSCLPFFYDVSDYG